MKLGNPCRQARSFYSFENGEFAVIPSPTAALPGCGFGCTRCETSVYLDFLNLLLKNSVIRVLVREKLKGHLSRDTCPLTHSCRNEERGGRRE